MTRMPRLLALAAVLVCAAAAPAWALGPVDGEATILYWNSDTESGGVSADSSSVGGRAEVWFVKKVGVSAALFRPSPDEGNDIDYLNLDVKWRLLSPTENNFLAVGAGWQKIDIGGDEDVDSSGVRLVAEGRVGLVGIVYAYGRVAYLPSLDDIDAGGTPLTDGSGTEYEAGVQLKPMPFVQFFLGYRSHEDSWTLGEDGPDVDIKTDGFVLGAGVNF